MKDLLSGSDLNKGNDDDKNKYRNRDTSENDRNRKAYRSGAVSVCTYVHCAIGFPSVFR